ncbi:hypothetical protein LAZ67_X001965 [Cordylochernes scorpioides]|uniref:Polyprotein n=1 Tax=Cordylochernes scorpioides TaxID=51811 RepID=A0ABY6LXX1_9ARAC|nr:hypothetical protein LAZ67_X001965 [Cordylochernes scorpioides]
MLCIWWDQLGVIYYELLQPNEIITGERYQQQLMRLSRALNIKRPLYAKRHDKVIYQHDNARPHVAKVVKETLEALQWNVLPHPLYSPYIAPSDYHMFRSMTHGLAEQHFTSYEEAKNWVNVSITSKDEEFFQHGIRMLPERWEKVVHKPNCPLRPIENNRLSPTYALEKWLAQQLKIYQYFNENEIVNCYEFKEDIIDMKLNGNLRIIYLDVESMFTSIPIPTIMDALNHDKHPEHQEQARTDTLRKELDAILEADPPKEEEKFKEWKKNDTQAKCILTCSMTDSLVALILTCKTGKEIWKALHARYEGDKRKIIIEARNDVSRLVMKREEKWEDYLYRAERLLEQARNLGADIEDEEFITSVIRGLPHKYNLIVLRLSNHEKLTIFDLRNSLKLYHERFSNDKKEENSSAFKVYSKEKYKHYKEMKTPKTYKCFICHKPGHKAAECWHNPENKKNKNATFAKDENRNDFAKLVKQQDNLEQQWILDSGASSHMTFHLDHLKNIQAMNKKITLADDSYITSESIGDGGHIQNEEGDTLLTASKIQDFYIINEGTDTCLPPTPKTLKISDTSWDIWHKRLGHINEEYMKMMQNDALVHKFNGNTRKDLNCVTCTQAKFSRKLFKEVKFDQSSQSLDILHVDRIGPIQPISIGKAKYILTIVDDYSRKILTNFLKSESDTPDAIKNFIERIENSLERKVKSIRSDNGLEYVNSDLE